VAVASLGNILGSVINWLIGRGVERFRDRRWFPASARQLERAQAQYRRFGYWSLLLAWVPIIGDPLTLVAGIMREPLWRFLILVSIGKIGRYAVLAAGVGRVRIKRLGRQAGESGSIPVPAPSPHRCPPMLSALTLILTCQLIGELVTRFFGLPLPGPVAGMALLFALLVLRGSVPETVGALGDTLLKNLSLAVRARRRRGDGASGSHWAGSAADHRGADRLDRGHHCGDRAADELAGARQPERGGDESR
jgi:hypothetical protein